MAQACLDSAKLIDQPPFSELLLEETYCTNKIAMGGLACSAWLPAGPALRILRIRRGNDGIR